MVNDLSAQKIHVNLLGEWVTLDDELDTIYNEIPSIWMEDNNLHEHQFIWVGYNGKGYKVHVSQIQISVQKLRDSNS